MNMNFFTVLEELDRIYEADDKQEVEVFAEEPEDAVDEADAQAQPEAEAIADEVPADEDEAEPSQLVLKCENCGALAIKAEADVEIDEKTDLANVTESCAFCEEADGYEVIGTFAPYDYVEIVDDEDNDDDDNNVNESVEDAAKGDTDVKDDKDAEDKAAPADEPADDQAE